ncbi:MAG TPA: hypothetical protein VE440_08355, partial [Gaiellaceae bacterium]|nr:hypothetical protein [Gaiellaceae bacterium]
PPRTRPRRGCRQPDLGPRAADLGGRRDRTVTREEAALLVAAVPEQERALWAAALYSGLRRGELMAPRWEDVALGSGEIQVRRSWGPARGPGAPKSAAGIRASRTA